MKRIFLIVMFACLCLAPPFSSAYSDDFSLKPSTTVGLTPLPYQWNGYTFDKRAIWYNKDNQWVLKDFDDTMIPAVQCSGSIGICIFGLDSNPLAFYHPSNVRFHSATWNGSTWTYLNNSYYRESDKINVNYSLSDAIYFATQDIKYCYSSNPNYYNATYYGGVSIDSGDTVFSSPWPTSISFPLSGSLWSRDILSEFGNNWNEYCNEQIMKHTGIDIEAEEYEIVYAAESGVVKVSALDEEWGGWVTIEHNSSNNPYTTVYIHIIPSVSFNDTVEKGDEIGTITNYGGAVHLHFGLRIGTYSNTSNRGRLPQSICGGDPAYPENFIDPKTLFFE